MTATATTCHYCLIPTWGEYLGVFSPEQDSDYLVDGSEYWTDEWRVHVRTTEPLELLSAQRIRKSSFQWNLFINPMDWIGEMAHWII